MRSPTLSCILFLTAVACRSAVVQSNRLSIDEARAAIMPFGVDPHQNSCVDAWQGALATKRERVVEYIHDHVVLTDRLIVLEEGLPKASVFPLYYKSILLINDRLVVGAESSSSPKVIDLAGSELARWLAGSDGRSQLGWVHDKRVQDATCWAVSVRVGGAYQRFGLTGAPLRSESVEEWVVGAMLAGSKGRVQPRAPSGIVPLLRSTSAR